MHTVRKRILELLKETGGATVADLAAALDMAPVSVRHHLDILQGDNLICVERVARKGNVGRPQQIYGLTDEAIDHFPNNFASLAKGLVRQLKVMLPPDQVTHAFCAMAHEIADEMSADAFDCVDLQALPVEERLARVADFLSERGYLADWEVADEEGGYLLHKYNCPYAAISGQHDELCLMDQVLIDTLLDQSCQRVETMAADNRCTYHVTTRVHEMESGHRGHERVAAVPITFETYEGQPAAALASPA